MGRRILRSSESALRKLAIGHSETVELALRHEVGSDLSVDDRTMALARVAALVALGAHAPSYVTACNAALANGATAEEVVGVLLAVGSLVGSVRMVAAAPRIALALGYDVDAALERGDPGALG